MAFVAGIVRQRLRAVIDDNDWRAGAGELVNGCHARCSETGPVGPVLFDG